LISDIPVAELPRTRHIVIDILVADEDFWVGERASEDEKCIAFFTASQ
jgi:hypothetical protein